MIEIAASLGTQEADRGAPAHKRTPVLEVAPGDGEPPDTPEEQTTEQWYDSLR